MGTVGAEVKTQKARGILALALNGPSRFSTMFVGKVAVFPQSSIPPFPFFARPCPMKPRHGFVDSRMIRTHQDWDTMMEEIKASGETNAEVIMMPFIPCTWSGILTPSGIAFGPGHEGATSGNGARSVPAVAQSKAVFLKSFQMTQAADQAGVTETPFVEFVEYQGKVEAVQLRNGPDVPSGNAYVPKDMIVQVVVKTNGEDLLEWETKMKELAAEQAAGVVIWHPQGCMSSHFAVQAIEQSKGLEHPFAVLIQDDEPQIGMKLAKTANVAAPMTPEDYRELASMVAHAVTNMSLEKKDYDAAIHLAIGALHAQALWGPERHLLSLRAAGIAFMMRFASAAILGELRHWHGGTARKTQLFELDVEKKSLSREQIYERAFDQHIKHIAPRMETAYQDFMMKGWSSSYGGKKWADCTRMTIGMFAASAAFLRTPNETTWMEVVTAWNHTVNVFHNTGQLLNKFISGSTMDILAKCPSYGLISDMVGELVINADDFGIHRAPQLAANLIDVEVPVTKTTTTKPKPITLPAEMDARWVMSDTQQVYVQMQAPFTVNKDYGMAFHFNVSQGLADILKMIPQDGTSLTGSPTKKSKGTVVTMEGVIVLKTSIGDLWVPLCQEDYLKQQIKVTQSGIDNNE